MKKIIFFTFLATFTFSIFAQNGNPWEHKVYRAVSKDGINWVKDTTLLFSPASTPEAVVDTTWTTVYLYYIRMNSVNSPESLMVSISPDGQTFLDTHPVIISGSTVIKKTDPCAVLTLDSKIRLYYIDSDSLPAHTLHSAVSSDGINFTEDSGSNFKVTPGKDFTDTTGGISSPDVFYAKGLWNLYLTQGNHLIRAISSDGIEFSRDSSFYFNNIASTSTYMTSCGYYRTYYCADSNIMSATSSGGDTLVMESGIRIQHNPNEFIYHPSFVHLLSGDFVIYYHSYKPNASGIHEISGSDNEYLINYPNPFHDKTSVIVPKEFLKKGDSFLFKIYDLSGKIVRTAKYFGNEKIIISKNNLDPGIYFYSIEQENLISRNGKFIIE